MSKTFRILSLIAVVFSLALASCTKEYTLTLQSNNPAYGVVAGGGTYAAGTQVTIMATPTEGYYFNNWSDGNWENPRTITLRENMTLIATFSNQPGHGNDTTGGGNGEAETLNGTMDQNRTLIDKGLPIDYVIDGTFYIDGNACLTIQPGVTIAFTGVDGHIIVSENAGLKMVGTAEKHIRFQGPINNNNVGSWGYVEYRSRRTDNQMEYVDFINGGSNEDFGVILLENGAKVSMKHCTIDGSFGYGIRPWYDEPDFYAFENNTIRNCAQSPIMINNALMLNHVGTGNVFENNGKNYILYSGYVTDNDATFANHGIPYFFDRWVDIRTKMVVDAGVTLLMAEQTHLRVSDEGMLQVNGTADNPVVIRSVVDEPGAWNGIVCESHKTTQGGNYIHHAVISGCGYDESACVETSWGGTINLENVTLNGSGYGLYISLPGEWQDDVYVYDWSQSPIKGSNITYNCTLGNVRVGDEVFDGSQIPAVSKGAKARK
ncbi:MAG: hypothetical protein MJZ99_08075 [Bacteroidales bacterium]|nr:hypothetical protein [Bacteroidales bacterium]